jgi:hypothetical protein
VHLAAYGAETQRRLAAWFDGKGDKAAWGAEARVYYGRQSRHEFLERTTWHAGQHARQLMSVLQDTLRITPDGPLGPEIWADLPMPAAIWDPA